MNNKRQRLLNDLIAVYKRNFKEHPKQGVLEEELLCQLIATTANRVQKNFKDTPLHHEGLISIKKLSNFEPWSIKQA